MYTAEQRLEIYKTLLRESLSPSDVVDKSGTWKKSNSYGFCFMIQNVINKKLSYVDIDIMFPELWAKATNPGNVYNMWKDWYEREEALAKCIIELQEGGGIV